MFRFSIRDVLWETVVVACGPSLSLHQEQNADNDGEQRQ